MTSANARRRQAALAFPHIIIDHSVCVYCGRDVAPRLLPTGEVRNYDHFIPLCYLALIQQHRSSVSFCNYLLPCCSCCNNIANSYLFYSLAERHAFVNHSLRFRHLTGVPLDDQLHSIAMSQELRSRILLLADLQYASDQIIDWPERLSDGSWQLSHGILRLCNSETISTVL